MIDQIILIIMGGASKILKIYNYDQILAISTIQIDCKKKKNSYFCTIKRKKLMQSLSL